MINYSTPFTPLKWEPPINPPTEHFDAVKEKFIESKIEDFAEQLMRHGISSSKISHENDELIDILYEFIEDNIEKFLEEPDCDA